MNITIIHGTCEFMSPHIKDNSIGGAVTSPPYFSAKDYGDKTEGNIGNADIDLTRTPYQVYLDMMKNVFAEVYRVLKPGRFFLMNAAPIVYNKQRYPVPYHLFNLMEEVGFDYADNIIWKKPDGISSSKRFGIVMQQPYPLYYKPNNIYEPCFLMRKPGKFEYPREPKLSIDKLKKFQNDVWNIQPDTHNDHPAPYPYQLPWRFIYSLCLRDEIVLDPFGGSGTTALAARDVGVDCVMFEYESKYIKMIQDRLQGGGGLGKFVEGAVDTNIKVIEQGEIKRSPTTSQDKERTKSLPPTQRPTKEPNKKQTLTYKKHTYVCDICDGMEIDVYHNKIFDYDKSEWKYWDNKCPACGMKVRDIR